jgi:hypothetical protein
MATQMAAADAVPDAAGPTTPMTPAMSASRFVIDVPLGLSQVGNVAQTDPGIRPFAGVRVGYDSTNDGLFFGGDGTLMLTDMESKGTAQVGSAQALVGAEVRGKLGYARQLEPVHLGGYGFVGVWGGVGAGRLAVYDDARFRFLAGGGARSGVGFEVACWWINLRAELAVGFRDRGFETTASTALGTSFSL